MLKKIYFLIHISIIPVTFCCALNTTVSDSIDFKKADFKTLQALAKAENKPLCIFVTGREIDANGKKSFFSSVTMLPICSTGVSSTLNYLFLPSMYGLFLSR